MHLTRILSLPAFGGRGATALALAAALVAGCTDSRGGPVPYEPVGFGAPDMENIAVPLSQQRLSPLDKVRISVFQVADLTGEYRVDAQGNIEFPLIGTVAAQGLMPEELGRLIATRLGERYLRSPNVQVALLEQTEQTITVDGSVRQPGVVPIRGSTTLMRAVALARGTSEDANPSRVIVFRTVQGQRMAAAFDLQAIRRAQAEDPIIYGNDIVVVDGSRSQALWRNILSTIPILGLFRPILY